MEEFEEIIPERAPDEPELPEGQPETPAEDSIADRVRIISPTRLVLKRFFRSKLSIVGLCMFLFLLLFSFLGPLFVPWSETEVDRTGGETVYNILPVEVKVGDEKFTVYTVEVYTPTINVHADPFTYSHEGENSRLHLFGTDENGRDTFVRLMYGGRMSMMLSFLVVLIYTLIGVVLGGLAGYFGKWVDMIIMRIVDIFNCLPSLPILMLASSMLETWGVPAESKIYALMGILTIFGWSGTARLVRGQILSLREQEFMLAAEATGISTARKVFKHLIPKVLPLLIVQATLGLGSVILYESTLSYLGLGVPFPYAAWGTMIGATSGAAGKDILENYPNLWVPAGICIILAVLAFNFVGDGLRDAFDPKAKR